MAEHTVCPRCGAQDSFIKGYLPDTCVCRVCQSQLDWREIPGCGPDCRAARSLEDEAGTSSSQEDPTGGIKDQADPSAGGREAEDTPASGSDA